MFAAGHIHLCSLAPQHSQLSHHVEFTVKNWVDSCKTKLKILGKQGPPFLSLYNFLAESIIVDGMCNY